MTARPWKDAWQEALYGSEGFFRRSVPGDHFRTNVAVPLFATAVRSLAERVDAALDFPDPFDVVDVGAGRGELLTGLGPVPSRWRLTGVDLADAEVAFAWTSEIPSLTGLLLANEWLDNVPIDIVENSRTVLVDPTGQETLGDAADDSWASRWWPMGTRVEVGASRDHAWSQAVSKVERGVAVAIDYGHTQADRRTTLTSYQRGRQVAPVPDGLRDLTAHVALDSCASATGAVLIGQRKALQGLGITAALPPATDPTYPLSLEQASQAHELLDPQGLGGFGWLVQTVGIETAWMPPMWGRR